MMWPPAIKDTFSRYDTKTECDRETDRRTQGQTDKTDITMHRVREKRAP